MSTTVAAPIGFIGLGVMGTEMVRRLLEHGYSLFVHDIDGAAVARAVGWGAIACDSPAAVANAAASVLVSLPTPDVVHQVALGPAGLVEGTAIRTYVDLSTTGAQMAQKVATALAQRNVVSLDAPVSGGVAGAAAGTLAVMVSGEISACDEMMPVLRVIGSRAIRVGDEVGQGQTLKLVNNLLAATTWAAASEALVMGVKAGLDPDVMVEVINASSGRSFATQAFVPAVLARRFDFGFRLELMGKDIRLALAEAEALGVSMPTSIAARQLYSFALAHGGAKEDVSALIKVLEDWGGTTLASRGCNAP